METISYIVLVPMVYLAVAVFVLGIIYRLGALFKKPKFAPTLQIYPEKKPNRLYALSDALFMPTVRRHQPVLWVFLMLFHICLIFLFIGHLELIREFSIIQLIEHQIFIGRGIIGLTMTIALIYFLFRRFASPTKDLSVPEDYYLLILLFLTVLFGSQMEWARSLYDFDSIGVDEYRSYLFSLVTFSPVVEDVTYSGHSFMLVLHIFFANLFLMVFPFSNLMHAIFSVPLNVIRRG